MKPTSTTNQNLANSTRHAADARTVRKARALPQTDYPYHNSATENFLGYRAGSSAVGLRAFREISAGYTEREARNTFLVEVGLFALIVMTAALPLLNSAHALNDLVRAFGAY